jgi:predicted  nucleic acid-binding Zn-ribbon protein
VATERKLILDLLARDKTGPATKGAADNLNNVGDAADAAARNTEKLGKSSRTAAEHVENLDREIDGAERELRQLAVAFAEAESAADRLDLSKAIRRTEADLRKLNKSKGLLSALIPDPADVVGAAGKLGTSIGTTAAESAGTALKSSQFLGPALAGVAVAAAPLIGATVSAAIIGGAGIGGVVGGALLASKDPQVMAAGKQLGDNLLNGLEARASVFVTPMLEAVEQVEKAFGQSGDDISKIFANSAEFVAPLTDGITSFIGSVTHGVAKLTDAAGPVIDELAAGIASLGVVIEDVFESLSDNGVDAAMAVRTAFGVLEIGIESVGVAINVLTESYGFLAQMGAFGQDAALEYARLSANAKLAADANDDVTTSLDAVAGAGGATAGAIKKLVDAVGDLTDENRTLYGSETDVAQALADTKTAIQENGSTLDEHTQKGRDNRRALEDLAGTLAANLDAYREVNGEGPKTDAVAAANRQSFIKLATELTGSKNKAIELANKLLGIPSVKPHVRVDTGDSAARIQAIKDSLARLPGTKTITIRTRAQIPAGLAQGFLMREHGGPVEKGHAYVVGEKRPEVFVPDQDGMIIPSVEQFEGMGGSGRTSGGAKSAAVQRLVIDVTGAESRFKALIREMFNNGDIVVS